jgi:nicotinamide riboside transporter PnuC
MIEPDVIRISLGVVGTSTAAILAEMESSAAIFAGCATGCYMVVAMVLKIRRYRRRDD